MDINPSFNSRAIFKCNEVQINEIKSTAFYYQLISRSKTAIGERVASALEIYICLTTFNEDECVDRLRLSFSFTRGSLSVCLLKKYSDTRPQ